MIKKLRFKFVLINMGIVTLMLCVILGLVLYFTSANLERQSIQMMQAVATSPAQTGQPGEQIADVDLPFFMLPSPTTPPMRTCRPMAWMTRI